MNCPSRMPRQPCTDFGLFVRSAVIQDDMNGLVCGHFGLDSIQEADEFLMPVALHVSSDHGSIQHIERGKQGRNPVAFVVMRHGRPATTLEWQARLRAIERLNSALFIDRDHDGMGWWRDVEPDDIVKLFGEGVRAWLDRHPRWTFHFVPTSCSWLNAVEGFFAKLTRRRLKNGVFHSVVDLQAAINRFISEHNGNPKPFVWKADPDEIIAAVRRGRQTLESIH